MDMLLFGSQKILNVVLSSRSGYTFTLQQKLSVGSYISECRHRESAWGVAMHGYLLAVSANSHTILIWNFRASTEGGDDAADAEEDPLRGVNERELVGHDHNIPAIDFSECGRYLVSGSIGTIRGKI